MNSRSPPADVELPGAVDPEADVHRATGLLRRLGLAAGDRVLAILEDSTDSFALGLACMLEGVVQVPVHHSIPRREAGEIAADELPKTSTGKTRRTGLAEHFGLT